MNDIDGDDVLVVVAVAAAAAVEVLVVAAAEDLRPIHYRMHGFAKVVASFLHPGT